MHQSHHPDTTTDAPASAESGTARLSRRHLVAGAASLSVAALAACTTDESSSTTTPLGPYTVDTLAPTVAPPAAGAGGLQLFSDPALNFQILFALGGAGLNAEVGEVVTAVNQANAAPGGATFQSVYDAFIAMGNQVASWADEAVRNGNRVTARSQLMRVAQYYNQALFFVLGTSTPNAEEAVFQKMDAAFTKAATLMDPPLEQVQIPYEGQTLPAWFVRAPGSGRRPTVILNNGSDAQNVDLWAYGAQAAQERGYHSLILTGPGQGELLFVRQEPFRPDWEQVITPVVDYLAERSDVDASKIALTGWSFGGALVARAAAFEPRLAGVVADPGIEDPFLEFPPIVQDSAEGDEQTVNTTWNDVIVKGSTPEQTFELKKRLEIWTREALQQVRAGQVPSDWYAISRRMQEFTVTDLLGRITVPFLVTRYDGDALNPQAQQVLDGLGSTEKQLRTFTYGQGAQLHDAPMAPQYRNEVVFDWLGTHLGT